MERLRRRGKPLRSVWRPGQAPRRRLPRIVGIRRHDACAAPCAHGRVMPRMPRRSALLNPDPLPASKVVQLLLAAPAALSISPAARLFHALSHFAPLFVWLGGQSGGQLLASYLVGSLCRRAPRPGTVATLEAPRSAAESHEFSVPLAGRAPGAICRTKFGRQAGLRPKSQAAELLAAPSNSRARARGPA